MQWVLGLNGKEVDSVSEIDEDGRVEHYLEDFG
jgi:hypothetical protein